MITISLMVIYLINIFLIYKVLTRDRKNPVRFGKRQDPHTCPGNNDKVRFYSIRSTHPIMKKKMKHVLLSKILLGLLWVFSINARAELSLAIYPWKDSELTYSQFRLLSEQLASTTGERVKLVLSRDSDAFWREFMAGKFDIVLLEQHHYLKLGKTLPYELVAAAEQVQAREDRSVLVVANESKIRSIRDIQGNRLILAKDPRELASHILPLQLINTAGLKQERDFGIVYSGNPHLILSTLLRSEQPMVAGMSELTLNRLMQANSVFASKIRLLATSSSYPTFHCWTMKTTLPEETRHRIKNYFAGLSSGTDAVTPGQKAGYARFYPITRKDLEVMSQVLSGR